MWNVNRLINDFKKQTRGTIWKFLDAMSMNYAVYSTHLKGLAPLLPDNDIYIYVNSTNLVVMCLGKNEGVEPDFNAIWDLSDTLRMLDNQVRICNSNIDVYGVFLTAGEVHRYYNQDLFWGSHNLKIIDGLIGLKNRTIEVNDDEDLANNIFLDRLIDTSEEMGAIVEDPMDTDTPPANETESEETEKIDDDEFYTLLNNYIGQSTIKEKENNDSDDTDDEVSEDTDDDVSEEDDEDVENDIDGDVSGDNDDNTDDTSFPDGEIALNHHLKVKVEILRPIANPRKELDNLIGCDDIKRCMDDLVALTSYNRMIREFFPGNKQHEVSLHSVFLGRPGTGKTTVCKIFGSLLHQTGALSKGHVVVCDRSTFIGTVWGDEERSMKQVLEMAKGGVLMIDEAYLLNGKNESDPGKLIIQLMMNILADETQRDIAVVLCGYKEPMMKLLSTNPGLQSRFPNKFEFQDFSVDELLEITKHRVMDYGYQFTDTAWEKYRSMLSQAYEVRDPDTWGNARFVTNQLERIYIQHAVRCVQQQPDDRSMLLTLTPEDIVPVEIPRQRAKVGF